jgi:hypothetical protein
MASLLPRPALLILPLALLMLSAAGARATIYYDVDFGTPPHTVGQPPAAGGGPIPRATVSSIVFGTPLVVAALGDLTDQPLQLSSTDGQGDQVSFSLSGLPAASRYCFSTQVLVSTAQGTADLAILFDAPSVRSIRFRADGTVAIFVSGGGTFVIGSYTLGHVENLRVEIDLGADIWNIYLDNVLAHAGSFGGATQLSSVRVSTPVIANPPGLLAGIDDLLLGDCATAAVADPGAVAATGVVLEQNVPNPFKPTTTIAFTLAAASPAHLAVYDVQGRLVRTLVAADLAAGRHEAAWDGRDERGRHAPNGHYLYRIEAGATSATRHMILLQ